MGNKELKPYWWANTVEASVAFVRNSIQRLRKNINLSPSIVFETSLCDHILPKHESYLICLDNVNYLYHKAIYEKQKEIIGKTICKWLDQYESHFELYPRLDSTKIAYFDRELGGG